MSSERRKGPAKEAKEAQESTDAKKVRLTPEARRAQLLEVASAIVGERGIEGLEMRDLAHRAGVTRPVVYRYFPTRHALVLALLEDFAGAIEVAYRDALVSTLGEPVDIVAKRFVLASSEVIEAKGAGPWHLLAMRGGDPEVAALGQSIHDRLLSPWVARIAEVTGISRTDLRAIAPIVIATGRAALDAWLDDRVSKKRAVEHGSRVVSAILREYAGDRQL